MEIYERIRELRKKYLKMSMEAFGERLGVSLYVINNIENNRLARPDQKLSLYKLICSEFDVNEEWLLNGTEPMFAESRGTFSLDRLVRERGCDETELQIVKAYFELDEGMRRSLIAHFKERLAADADAARTDDDAPTPTESSVSAAEAAYEKSLGIAPSSASTASNTTAATDEVG